MQTYYVFPPAFQVQSGPPVQLLIQSYHLQIFKFSLFPKHNVRSAILRGEVE